MELIMISPFQVAPASLGGLLPPSLAPALTLQQPALPPYCSLPQMKSLSQLQVLDSIENEGLHQTFTSLCNGDFVAKCRAHALAAG